MKENFKKIFIYIFTILLLGVGVVMTGPINVNAEVEKTSLNGSTYYVDETPDERNLGYGVNYRREIAHTTLDVEGKGTGNAAGLGGGGPIEINVDYPQQVNVLEFNVNDDIQLVPWAVLTSTSWNVITVRNAATNYESYHPGWKVVAAVNGDFFQINTTHESNGVTVSQGDYFKGTSSNATIGVKNNGVGKQLVQTSKIQSAPFLTIYNAAGEEIKHVAINKLNTAPGANEISLYCANEFTNLSNVWTVTKPTQAVNLGSFYGKGKITSYEKSLSTLESYQFAIASNNEEINALLGTDVLIRAQYEFTDPSVADIDSFFGVGQTPILVNNVPNDSDKNRHPRTVIGQKEDGTIVCAVIDGRQPDLNMYGATFSELSAMMSHFGCVDAWNLDGGGSSTLLVRKQEGWDYANGFNNTATAMSNWYVTNSPSDGNERSDGNCLLIVAKVPEIVYDFENITKSSITVCLAQLTVIEKYSELYITLNGERKKVVNGKATFNGLATDTSYKARVYALVGDEYRDLMTYATISTALEMTSVDFIKYNFTTRAEKDYISLTFNYLDRKPISGVSITLNGVEYITSGQTLNIPKTAANIKALYNCTYVIIYDLNDLKGRQYLELQNCKIDFNYNYLQEEQLTAISGSIESMFK